MSATPTHDHLVGLSELSHAEIDAARAVYDAGFPAALRAPFSELTNVRADERTQILQASDRTVLGLALVRDLGPTSWTFLRYFVVTAERRGQGIGGRLWVALCRDLATRGRDRLLFDVEDPDDPVPGDVEIAERRARVRFYRRLGAATLATASYTPPHHGEPGTVPIPLALMAAAIGPDGAANPPTLTAEELADCVRTVLVHRYAVSPDDATTAANRT